MRKWILFGALILGLVELPGHGSDFNAKAPGRESTWMAAVSSPWGPAEKVVV